MTDQIQISAADITPIGYQGAAQHTYTPACDGFHEPGQCDRRGSGSGCDCGEPGCAAYDQAR
jgi:hypothetical protein